MLWGHFKIVFHRAPPAPGWGLGLGLCWPLAAACTEDLPCISRVGGREALSLSGPGFLLVRDAMGTAHHEYSLNSCGYKAPSLLSSGGSAVPAGAHLQTHVNGHLPWSPAHFSCLSATSGDLLDGGFLQGHQPLWHECSHPTPHSPSLSL